MKQLSFSVVEEHLACLNSSDDQLGAFSQTVDLEIFCPFFDAHKSHLINDYLSFMRFLGLGLSDQVPNAKTVSLFREHLTEAGAIQKLFERFDAPLVAAPKQRNTNGEKADLREGRIPKAGKTNR